MMGKPKLTYYPIRLRFVNQHCTFPIGSLTWVLVSINGVLITTDFEVIEIMDDINPYLALLGIN